MSSAREAALERPSKLPLGARLLVDHLSALRWGSLEGQLPGGRSFVIRGPEPGLCGVIHIHAPWRLLVRGLTRGAVGFAESYMAGEWSSPDLAALLTLLCRNDRVMEQQNAPGRLGRLALALHHRRNRNTRRGSRRNIAAHYDLGNDFYRLWLDDTMTYSAAVHADDDEPLEQAQIRKYRALLELLDVRPGDHILEIGCGWGGFALEAARAGARVTALTLSGEQLAWARQRAAQEHLSDAVEFRLQDYRDVRGSFDHIVSIEMLEAVGEDYWPVYFDTLAARVRPGGRIALHGITIAEDSFETYRANPDFIQRYVFPGGMLPTRSHLLEHARRVGLRVQHNDGLGQHYARTLAIWHQHFCAQAEIVRERFDERFLRMWRYYLAYCEAGFRERRIDLQRLVLTRP
jgi:cyclopropane-fatty-acyl-phospholipid synthase